MTDTDDHTAPEIRTYQDGSQYRKGHWCYALLYHDHAVPDYNSPYRYASEVNARRAAERDAAACAALRASEETL